AQNRDHDRCDHDHQAQDQRAAEAAPDVAHGLLLEQIAEPVENGGAKLDHGSAVVLAVRAA
ncbi:MAG: hypothetical protein ABF298_00120, partial [Alteriqipengyuania sp.]